MLTCPKPPLFAGHTCSSELLCSTIAELLLRTAFLLFHSSSHKGAEEEGGKLGLGWHGHLFLPNLCSNKSNQAPQKPSSGEWHAIWGSKKPYASRSSGATAYVGTARSRNKTKGDLVMKDLQVLSTRSIQTSLSKHLDSLTGNSS